MGNGKSVMEELPFSGSISPHLFVESHNQSNAGRMHSFEQNSAGLEAQACTCSVRVERASEREREPRRERTVCAMLHRQKTVVDAVTCRTSDMPQVAQQLESDRIAARTVSQNGSTVFSRVASFSRVESSNTVKTACSEQVASNIVRVAIEEEEEENEEGRFKAPFPKRLKWKDLPAVPMLPSTADATLKRTPSSDSETMEDTRRHLKASSQRALEMQREAILRELNGPNYSQTSKENADVRDSSVYVSICLDVDHTTPGFIALSIYSREDASELKFQAAVLPIVS